jgi:hypothetical protein
MSRRDPLLERLVRRPLDGTAPAARAEVPCATCRRCCQGNSIVMLLPQDGDVVESYEHEIVELPGAGRGPILTRHPNGDCVYLGPAGCTIHDRAPKVCRVFDCRGAYLAFMDHPRHERRRMAQAGYVDLSILYRGKDLIEGEP